MNAGHEIENLLREARIEYKEPRGAQQWINLRCPMCDDTGMHLGINMESGACHCWKCGRHRLYEILARLLGKEVYSKLRLLGDLNLLRHNVDGPKRNRKPNDVFRLPTHTAGLAETMGMIDPQENGSLLKALSEKTMTDTFEMMAVQSYLEKRGFDVETLALRWGVRYTRYESDFPWRIVIPIYDDCGQPVSWTARDWTGKQKPKYMTCPADREILPAKELLFGEHMAVGNSVVVTEGPFDAMKIGPGAVATFGTSWTQAQMKRLRSGRWNVVNVLFDPERRAQQQAAKLAAAVAENDRVTVRVIDGHETDPGDFDEKTVEEIRKKYL